MTACCGCCASLVTGCYGCHSRHDVEKRPATKLTERLWFIFVLLVSFTSLANMFFWLSAVNDSADFNRDLAEMTGLWWRYYIFFMALSCALCGYAALLLIFAFLHIAIGQQLHLHGVHKIGIVLDLTLSVAFLVFPCTVLGSSSLWHFVPQSLQFAGPFLHLIGVVVMTGLSWFVAGGMGTLQRKGLPIRDVALWYFLALLGLYISPVFIRSPCLLKYEELPPRPLVFAYGGAKQIGFKGKYYNKVLGVETNDPNASEERYGTERHPRVLLAPENTPIAFELALDVYNAQGIHTDVRISYDGVPYIMRDEHLGRTTNVADVFPERYADHSDSFTLAELKQLNAGSWFITCNPFGNANGLTEAERILYRQQKIPTLGEMLRQVGQRNKTILLDVRPPPDDHPYSDDWWNTTLQTIIDSGVAAEDDVNFWDAPDNDTKYTFVINTFDERRLIMAYNDIAFSEIRNNASLNITTNVWTVNEDWLFSLFWCAGATSISTSSCQRLRTEDAPLWQLSPLHFLVMWILFDAVSFVWVIIIFIIQISGMTWVLFSHLLTSDHQVLFPAEQAIKTFSEFSLGRRKRRLQQQGDEPPERYNYRHFMALEELSKNQKAVML